MADTNLTQDQARALLEKLAKDDDFRALFETAPAKALYELGVDEKTIVHLPASCLCPRTLAAKDHYEDLLQSRAEDLISSAMDMYVPLVGFKAR
ncbi:MAG: putative modified peptide [Rhodanobacteraceae bacterium]|jgi:putative modified peptide|nr:putative modified peptide [Rhodanobacteraceae bacterium]